MVDCNTDIPHKGLPQIPTDWWIKQHAKNPEPGIFDDIINANIKKELGNISVFKKDKS